jgi:hypothetical protein
MTRFTLLLRLVDKIQRLSPANLADAGQFGAFAGNNC